MKIVACIGIPALAALSLATGCAMNGGEVSPREQYITREKAYGLIDESETLEAQGSRLLALERLNRSALIHESPLAYYHLGRQFEAAGKTAQAATAYRRALELAPDYQEAEFSLVALGFEPASGSVTAETVEMARLWAAENPVTPIGAVAAPATAAGRPGLTPAEREALRRDTIEAAADNRTPTVEEVKTVLFAQAAEEAPLPSAIDPTYSSDQDIVLGSPAYHARKASQMRRRGDYQKAAGEYARALEADPGQIESRLNLGDAMMKLERHQEALYHYERARDDFPGSPRPFIKLGTYYLTLNQLGKSREQFQTALAKDAYNLKAFNNLAVIAMREKDFTSAASILDNMIELDPAYANAHYNRAIIAEDVEKDIPLALEHYNRYLDLDGPLASEVSKYVRALERKQAK